MAQGRSTRIISMIDWIRTSRLSTKDSRSYVLPEWEGAGLEADEEDLIARERGRHIGRERQGIWCRVKGVGCRV